MTYIFSSVPSEYLMHPSHFCMVPRSEHLAISLSCFVATFNWTRVVIFTEKVPVFNVVMLHLVLNYKVSSILYSDNYGILFLSSLQISQLFQNIVANHSFGKISVVEILLSSVKETITFVSSLSLGSLFSLSVPYAATQS